MNDLRILHDQELFSRLQLFWGVSFDSVAKHLDRCSEFDLPKGEILISPTKRNSDVFVIQSGELSVYLQTLDSDPITSLSVGETVGEMSLVDESVPSAFVVATEDCHILNIPQDVLWDMVSASHAIARNLLLILSNRVRAGNKIILQNKEMLKQLKEVAMVDALTGIHNRRWLDLSVEKALHRCKFNKSPFSVILVDVDNFKKYNDTQGHLGGDDALRTVAKAMRECLRPSDMYARYGGEEFIFMLPDLGIEEACIVAERLRHDVENAEVITSSGNKLPSVTISLGIAELSDVLDTKEKLIAASDEALYRAKGNGRNRYSL